MSLPPPKRGGIEENFHGKLAQGKWNIQHSLSVVWSDYTYNEHSIIPVLASGISSMPHYSLSVLLYLSYNKTLSLLFILRTCWLFLSTQPPPCLKGASGGIMVSKLDKQTCMSEFESHWVPLSYGLVPHLSKMLSKLQPPPCLIVST